ncbi:KR domain-containing protein [Phaeosphaeriaceae sp. PMI808]|nr:KR domain-containing protein [Phaeosphaeriaceae sp. PMI808]
MVHKLLTTELSWTFGHNASYMIAGGLGGIGRATCRWMAKKGVKHLIFPSRSGPKNQAARDLIAELQDKGVNVVAPICDVSSLAGVFGNLSQANYAAGNTFQDALADFRTTRGEHAVSINLGWVRTIGIISEKEEYQNFRMKGADMAKIEESELLSLLNIYCIPAQKHADRSASQVLLGTVTPAVLLSKGIKVPDAMDRPLFSTLSHCLETSISTEHGDAMDVSALFRQTDDPSQREVIASDALAQKLARSLSVPAADINRDRPLFEFGVDSLVAVELRNWIGKEFPADVAVFDIMGSATVASIGSLVVKNAAVGK